jgi:hypothetical protein
MEHIKHPLPVVGDHYEFHYSPVNKKWRGCGELGSIYLSSTLQGCRDHYARLSADETLSSFSPRLFRVTLLATLTDGDRYVGKGLPTGKYQIRYKYVPKRLPKKLPWYHDPDGSHRGCYSGTLSACREWWRSSKRAKGGTYIEAVLEHIEEIEIPWT